MAPLALCPNTYQVLRKYADAYTDIDGPIKDELIGALSAMGSYVRAYYNLACVPMECVTSSKAKAPITT